MGGCFVQQARTICRKQVIKKRPKCQVIANVTKYVMLECILYDLREIYRMGGYTVRRPQINTELGSI